MPDWGSTRGGERRTCPALGGQGHGAGVRGPGRIGRALVVPADHAILFALPESNSNPAGLRSDDGRLARGRRSRERIRRAARELFRERGFDGATLRAIAERAGMGASSIYRHVETKEELLVQELADLQEEAWARFRRADLRERPVAQRLTEFFSMQHELLAEQPDLTIVALRATTFPDQRVARHVLALQDRSIGLIAEILQAGRTRGELAPDVDLLTAARALFHVASAVRVSWANGQLDEAGCRDAIAANVDLLVRGVAARR